MSFDPHSLRVLEFDQVSQKLCGFTQWAPGHEALLALGPAPDIHEIAYRQAVVKEALVLLEEGVNLGLGGLQDIRRPVKAAGRGGVLGSGLLLDVHEVLLSSRKAGRVLSSRRDNAPLLAGEAGPLVPFPRLEQLINSAIGPDGRVLDSASPRLGRLRSDIRRCEAQVHRSLQHLLRRSDLVKMLQEPLVTQRQGRSVVPVKADYRGQFPGLVIDQSSSGATVFMEPYAVLELANRLRSAQLAEEKEVEAVLASISAKVGEHEQELLDVCLSLGRLDAFVALGRYALEHGCNLPEVVSEARLRLVNARHPMLGPECVPITIELGDGFRSLVVTGPNTGGKTVCLKTVGLLVTMALCGYPVPAGPGTIIPWLDGVWADIGDEQSITQSLSTFSAHLTQILRILPQAGSTSLVLLDELGAGTDPAEGGALGIALLDHLNARGGLTLVTTHLSQLKIHAAQTAGFQNAAVEFDAASLQPTYRIIMGVPGRSNALQIADRLGLPPTVLRRAREHLGQGHLGVEGLLDDLEQERDAVRALEQRLDRETRELTELRKSYEERMRAVEEEKERILGQAGREAETMVAEARKKVHGLLQDFRKRMNALGKARREALEQARRLAREAAAQASPPPESSPPDGQFEQQEPEPAAVPDEAAAEEASPEEAPPEELPSTTETPAAGGDEMTDDEIDQAARFEARQAEAELDGMSQRFEPYRPSGPRVPREGTQLESGAHVYARKFGQEGVVLSQRGRRVEVRLGAVRMTLDQADLEVVEPPPSTGTVVLPESGRDTISSRVDLRGMTVDEGIFELDRCLDRAAMARLEKLEIIHGKGTGALRAAVQHHLKSHPLVAEQRLGEIYEGGWGVTVVKLRL